MSSAAGRLAVCATPIGHLEDITLRVLGELRSADLVLAEDTRRTGLLLRHFEIVVPVWSFHEHNEHRRLPDVLARLRAGSRIALVSDAGTPGVADPGFRLVRAAVDAGVAVTALPGASALLPALILSALPLHAFAFYGFPPRTAGALSAALRRALDAPHTSVWYEAPQRLPTTLATIARLGFGDRRAAVARELTKVHEDVVRGTVVELARHFAQPPRGEIVLCVAARAAVRGEPPSGDDPAAVGSDGLDEAVEAVRTRQAGGIRLSAAVAATAAERGLSRRHLYRACVAEVRGVDEAGP